MLIQVQSNTIKLKRHLSSICLQLQTFHELLPNARNAEKDGRSHSQETVLEGAGLEVERAGKIDGCITRFDVGADEGSDDVDHHACDVRQGQVPAQMLQ